MLLDPDWLRGPSTGWIVVNTHPHRERLSLDNLARQQFNAYCPTILKRVRHARRVQDVPRPMFPGYVFVQVSLDTTRWRPMLSTQGVRSVVRCGERLSFIDNAFIASLKAREVGGLVSKPTSPYSIGQKVCIAGGPFDGLVATIIEMTEKDRLLVLMELLNGTVKVRVESTGVRELT
jgi:transcriptional antiterminator RfaH